MLDQVCIFSTSGYVLWSKTINVIRGNPIDCLIREIFLEGKAGSSSFTNGCYALKWALVNELDLVIVTVYQKVLTLYYIETLLERIKMDIITRYGSILARTSFKRVAYDRHFDRIYQEVENLDVRKLNDKSKLNGEASQSEDVMHEEDTFDPDAIESLDSATIEAARARLQARAVKNRRRSSGSTTKTEKQMEDNKEQGPIQLEGKLSSKQLAALDRSKRNLIGADNTEEALLREASTFIPDKDDKPQWQESDSESSDEDVIEENAASLLVDSLMATSQKSYVPRFFRGIFWGDILTADDLNPALNNMRQKLMDKNVAADVTEEICDAVRASLKGQKRASFTRVKTLVQSALQDSIMRILTPGKSIDLLRAVMATKESGGVYSIVVMGINGVGKSTSLAKLAYYLKQNGIDVMLAACDTYRSGAVEQLRVHARCLNIPLFEMGYAKDPSSVAVAALQHARLKKHDCVLIDTAGRMQNNRPLMNALGRLVSDCKPDLRLFVGEALVGNDGIDQIGMFNEALASSSTSKTSHVDQVDAIILTKFDTVDLKVGAALSMCHKTGQPILFVGTGQKYSHLRRLNTNFVLKALFT